MSKQKETKRVFTCEPDSNPPGSGSMHMNHLYKGDACALLLSHGAQNLRLEVTEDSVALQVDAGRHALRFTLYDSGYYGSSTTTCEAWIR